MASGLTDHVWSISKIVYLVMTANEQKPKQWQVGIRDIVVLTAVIGLALATMRRIDEGYVWTGFLGWLMLWGAPGAFVGKLLTGTKAGTVNGFAAGIAMSFAIPFIYVLVEIVLRHVLGVLD
jgi:hypothetical protein